MNACTHLNEDGVLNLKVDFYGTCYVHVYADKDIPFPSPSYYARSGVCANCHQIFDSDELEVLFNQHDSNGWILKGGLREFIAECLSKDKGLETELYRSLHAKRLAHQIFTGESA